tara:strand:+ start:130 stop:462 length:333 start_codon:yes stop_codon:yes gene_type:complete
LQNFANAIHYGWAMKDVPVVRRTSSFDGQYETDRKQNGVMPDVFHFNILINTLLHDEEIDAAQHIKYMMARCRAEIAPDDITKKTMARGEELASRGRPAQFKLKRKIEYM